MPYGPVTGRLSWVPGCISKSVSWSGLLIGALGVLIAEDFRLTPSQKGLLVAVALLSGALLRILVGASCDRYGTKLCAWASTEVALRRRRVGVSRVTEWGSISR